MKNIYKWIFTMLILTFNAWLLTRPYIFKPFSNYSAYDHGYKAATGHYPDDCNNICCKAHGKGFWIEFFSRD